MDLFPGGLFPGGMLAPIANPRQRVIPKPTEEQQNSVLMDSLGGLMSGLQWIGDALDKSLGGRTVRALGFDQAGNFDPTNASLADFAHLIPFSDTLGLTDQGLLGNSLLADKNTVASPTDIRRQNITEDVKPFDNPYVDWLPNLAMDVGVGALLDPATYIVGPGKALTQKGIEATAAGSRAAKLMSKYAAGNATLKVAAGSALDKQLAASGAKNIAASPFMQTIEAAKNTRVLGTSPAAIINEIKAGERGLFGLKVPFMEHPLVTVGGGSPTAAKLAELAYYNPATRAVRDIFDTRVKGNYDKNAQMAADLLHTQTINAVGNITDQTLAINKRMGELGEEWGHASKYLAEQNPELFKAITGGLDPAQYADQMTADQFVRAIGELNSANGATSKMRELAKLIDATVGTQTPENVMLAFDQFDQVAEAARGLQDTSRAFAQRMGVDIADLHDDFVEHFHRRIADQLKDYFPKGKKLEAATDGVTGAIARSIRNVEGGTFKINAMTRDPMVTGWGGDVTKVMPVQEVEQMLAAGISEADIHKVALRRAADKVEQVYGIQKKPILDELGNQLLDEAGEPAFDDIPLSMAHWLSKLPPQTLETGLFGRSFTTDMMDYSLRTTRRANALNAVHDFMAATANEDSLGPTVAEVFGKTGKTRRYRDVNGTWHNAVDEGMIKVSDDGVAEFMRRWKKLNPDSEKTIDDLRLPEAFRSTAENLMRYHLKPEEAHGLIKAYDRALGFYKNSLYTPYPASHVRNGISGLWQNMVTAFRNPGDGSKAIAEATAAMAGKGNKEWLDAFKAYGLMEGGLMDDFNAAQKAASTALPTFGTVGSAIGDYTVGTVKNVLRPDKTIKNIIKPVEGGLEVGIFAGGRKIGEVVEFINRYSHFAALKARGWSNAAAARSVKLAHYDYTDLTAAERTIFKRLIPFYCVPEHSEALTRDGWKTWQQIEFGEELLTYNVEKDCLEWQPCLEVAAFAHHQDLMVLENTRHRLEFTPEHRWPVRQRGGKVSHPYGDYEYPDKIKVVTGEELNTNMAIVVTAEFKDNDDSLLTPDQARLLGWLVTDGYHRHRGNYTEAMIYQHPKKFLEEVLRVAGGNPRNPHPDTGVICVPVLNERVKEIKQYLDNDQLIKVVTRLSRDAAEAMYDAMYKADGVTSKNRVQDSFAATKPGVLEAFRVLATMLGKRASAAGHGSYVSHNRFLKIAGCTKKMERYDGIVWCPRTENGTWVMRQNGMITITGNTFARKNLPAQLRNLIDEPGGRTAQTIRAINTGREQSKEKNKGTYIPSFLGEGMVIPLGKQTPEGMQNYGISRGLLPVEEAFNRIPFMEQSVFGTTNEATLPDMKYGMENIGTMLTPAISIPGQYMAGRQWWSHRNLGDLYQEPTDDQTANFLMYSSPLSRGLSMRRTVADERKTKLEKLLNLLVGGTRVTTVDVPKWKNIEARQILERQLEPLSAIREGHYLYPTDINALTPDQVEQLSVLNEIVAETAKMNRDRKKAGK